MGAGSNFGSISKIHLSDTEISPSSVTYIRVFELSRNNVSLAMIVFLHTTVKCRYNAV